jgi:hypothetical protein
LFESKTLRRIFKSKMEAGSHGGMGWGKEGGRLRREYLNVKDIVARAQYW